MFDVRFHFLTINFSGGGAAFRFHFSVTPKWGLDKRGLGNQSFLQKSLKNIKEQPKIVEKSYKIYAKTTTQGGGAKRRPLGAPPKAAPAAFGIYFV